MDVEVVWVVVSCVSVGVEGGSSLFEVGGLGS